MLEDSGAIGMYRRRSLSFGLLFTNKLFLKPIFNIFMFGGLTVGSTLKTKHCKFLSSGFR